MIFIPRHWSLDPGATCIGTRSTPCIGRKARAPRTEIEQESDGKRPRTRSRLNNQDRSKSQRPTGDKRYDYVHGKMGKPLTTDQSWVKRHLRIARKTNT